MNLELEIAATLPKPAHPDDECSCGTTGNGAKPATSSYGWVWRGASYGTGSEQQRNEMRDLQAAIDYWVYKHPHPHQLRDKQSVQLFDSATADPQLAAAILAHKDGKDVEYQVGSIGHWNRRKTQTGGFYPSFDGALNWRPAPPPKPKRPHADLIEKRLEDVKWSYRTPRNGSWLTHSTPAFNPDFEYKCEPAFTEKRKALVRDWLSGTEYQVKQSGNWVPADTSDMLKTDAEFLRKKPTTQKMRSRTAVMKSTVSGGLPFTMSATTGEQESYIASLKQFIRWMGPWQETEVEVDAQ